MTRPLLLIAPSLLAVLSSGCEDAPIRGPFRDARIEASTGAADLAAAREQAPPADLRDGASGDGPCPPEPPLPAPQKGSPPLGVEVGALVSHATIHSIGFELELTGDTDYDASCSVLYRVAGACHWQQGLPLFRTSYAWHYHTDKASAPTNKFAGSLLFLAPGTTYEIKLTVTDPDGGSSTLLEQVKTRPLPELPAGGRTLHVAPGGGGGTGTQADPFKGILTANAKAQPGDIFLLHQGSYGGVKLSSAGKPGQPVVWRAAGDGQVLLDYASIAASHIWVEGCTFKKPASYSGAGLKASGSLIEGVVVSRNSFSGYHYSISLAADSKDWYIADNTIVGDNDPTISEFSGEGIELNHSSGHVVAYNRISLTADGVSYALRNCDIYGNDIFGTSDDGIEPDYGFENIRLWGNRIHNPKNFGLSFQPMKAGPWYIIRNQVIGAPAFKFRTQDRMLIVNNTFVNWGHVASHAQFLMLSLSRNNLYISASGTKPVWYGDDDYASDPTYYNPATWTPDWRTDVDHDGFDWGTSATAFVWQGGKSYPDLPSFVAASGVEKHGVRVFKEQIFESYNLPTSPTTVGPLLLTLKDGAAVDAGEALPNVADLFQGKAPDLGAYERGRPVPHYGPRSDQDLKDHALYWAWH